MDDILDLIQDVAESVTLYDLQRVTPEAQAARRNLPEVLRARESRGRHAPERGNVEAILKTLRGDGPLEPTPIA